MVANACVVRPIKRAQTSVGVENSAKILTVGFQSVVKILTDFFAVFYSIFMIVSHFIVSKTVITTP